MAPRDEKTKRRLVEAFGGKCAICGYHRCNKALDFHHLDPTDKETTWGELNGQIRSWARIVDELAKCVMICSNCHREVHAGIAEVPSNAPRISANCDYRPDPTPEYDDCSRCGSQKKSSWSYCKKCINVRKVDWAAVDVNAVIEECGSYQAAGRKLGISGAAVKRQWKKNS